MDRQQLEELQRRAEASLKNNKVYYLYYVLRLLKSKYSKLIEFSFDTIEIIKTIGIERDKLFMNYAFFSDKSWVIALCSFFFVISFVSFCVNCQIIINAKKRIKEEMKRQHEWED